MSLRVIANSVFCLSSRRSASLLIPGFLRNSDTWRVTLVIFAAGCYTLVTCSADDTFGLFKAGCLFSQSGKETNCVSTCFRAWAARHVAPPGLAHPVGYRVTEPQFIFLFCCATSLCSFS